MDEKAIGIKIQAASDSLKRQREVIEDSLNTLEIAQEVLHEKERNLKNERARILSKTDFKAQDPPITNKEGREGYVEKMCEELILDVSDQRNKVRELSNSYSTKVDEYKDMRTIIRYMTALYSSLSED